MLIAHFSLIPEKATSLSETHQFFEKNFLPLCLTYSSLIQPVGEGELYLALNLTDPQHLIEKLLEEATSQITAKQGAFKLLVGVGSSKLIARIATRALKQKVSFREQLQQGILKITKTPESLAIWVTPGKEKDFLDPLPLSYLPLTEKEQKQLFLLGVKTIRELRVIPLSALRQKFGQTSYLWQEYSQGKDYSSVLSLYPPDQITLHQGFASGLNNKNFVEEIFKQASSTLAKELQKRGKGCHSLELKINNSASIERNFSKPTYDSEAFLSNLLVMFEAFKLKGPLFSFKIVANNFKPFNYHQVSLFEFNLLSESIRVNTSKEKLEKTIASLQRRYVSSFISYGKDLSLNRREEVLKIWDPLRQVSNCRGVSNGSIY